MRHVLGVVNRSPLWCYHLRSYVPRDLLGNVSEQPLQATPQGSALCRLVALPNVLAGGSEVWACIQSDLGCVCWENVDPVGMGARLEIRI